MRFKKQVKLTFLSVICLLASYSAAHALLWPTFDASAIAQNAQSITQQIQQYKTQIMESKLAGSINKAIGDAKDSISKFSLDEIEKAKKKAEKAKKVLETAKKWKEEAEKAKAEFDKKKADYEKYKAKLNKYKEDAQTMVSDAKGKINEAKEVVADAKEMANAAKDKANSTVNEVQSNVAQVRQKTDSVTAREQVAPQTTDVSTPATAPRRQAFTVEQNSVNAPINKAQGTVVESVLSTTSQPSLQSEAITTAPVSVMPTELKVETSEVIAPAAVQEDSSQQTSASEENATVNVAPEEITSQEESADKLSVPTAESRVRTFTRSVNQAIKTKDVKSLDALSRKNTQDIINSDDKIYEPETPRLRGRRAFEKQSFFFDVAPEKKMLSRTGTRETLKFASVSCEFGNSMQHTDDGEIVIIPKTLAQECCLKAESLKDMEVIKKCINDFLVKMNDSDSQAAASAKGVYVNIIAEQSKDGLVESLENVKDSSGYLTNVLLPYKASTENALKDGSNNDQLSALAITNTQLLYLFNRIRRIYASSLAHMSLSELSGISKKTLDEDTELGIGEVKQDSDSTVIRSGMDDTSLNYPVIPDNLAKKCGIKISESGDGIKDCYLRLYEEMNQRDVEPRQVAKDLANNVIYQDTLNNLSKALYQKIKSVQYDEQLDKVKDEIAEGKTIRTNADGLFNTDYEIQEVLDDILNLYAAKIANTGLKTLHNLIPPSDGQINTGTEG